MNFSKNTNTLFLDKIIFITYSILIFFIPLILTSVNYELFEFNKMTLVYLGTTIILVCWLIKIIFSNKFVFKKGFLFYPMLIFFVSQLISTFISVDQHTSIFGYYSRFNGGLLSTICYLILYFAILNNFQKKQVTKLIKIGSISAFLVAIYGIAQHFGIDKNVWVQDVQARVFSTLGQPNWLAAYLNIFLFLTLGDIFSKNSIFPKTISFVFYSAYYLCLLYTNSRSGFIGFIIPFLIFLTINIFKEKQKISKSLIAILLITLTISFIGKIPFNLKSKVTLSFLSDVEPTETITVNQDQNQKNLLITPSSDIRKIVWQGAIELWKRYPLFGTGTETFGYTYYWVRPIEHNLTSEWDFLYNKAHNEYLNFAANSGTIGILAYLSIPIFFLIFCVNQIKKNKKSKSLVLGFTCGFLSILITNFFGFSVVVVGLLFFTLPAILQLILENQTEKETSQPIIKIKFQQPLIFLVIAFGVIALVKIGQYWLADYYFAQGSRKISSGLLNSGLENLEKAIKFNPLEPNFYAQRSVALAQVVASSYQNSQNKKEIQDLASQAIADSQKALLISPFHINFYKNQVKVWYYLAFYNLDYLESGIETLKLTQDLAPTDPKIPYNLGLIYQTLDKNNLAKENFERALELKPNFNEAKASLEQIKGIKN